MTSRHFTLRDAALDLGRREQLSRQSISSYPMGHPLEVARAIRSLAAVRGRDPSLGDPVAWEPAASPSPFARETGATSPAVPPFLRSANVPPAPVFYPSAPPGMPPAGGTVPDQNASGSWTAPPGTIVCFPGSQSPDDTSATTSLPAGVWCIPDCWPGPPSADGQDSPRPIVLPSWTHGCWDQTTAPVPTTPGSTTPGPDTGRPGTRSTKGGSKRVEVRVEGVPRTLEERLQKITRQARRELQDFRLISAAQRRGPRR